MLSDKIVCSHCGDEKTNKEELLPIEVLRGYILHFFCVQCGSGFQVSVEGDQYRIEDISVEE